MSIADINARSIAMILRYGEVIVEADIQGTGAKRFPEVVPLRSVAEVPFAQADGVVAGGAEKLAPPSDENWERISGETYHKEHDVKPKACAKCFMACGRMARISKGRHKGLQIEGPEYETIYAFGGLCLINSIEEIAYLNDVCDRLGIDTITAGNLCAFTIEAARQGRIDYKIDYGVEEYSIIDCCGTGFFRFGKGCILLVGKIDI